MKLAIISDTHDNIQNLEKFLSFCKKEKIKKIIHCGDICKIEIIKKLEELKGKVYFSLGNADLKEEIKNESFQDAKIFEDFGEIEIDNLRIAFCHKISLAKKISQEKKHDFIFYGHTHKPWIEKRGNSILVNPGNLSGIFYKSTFAILDTKKKEVSLKILEEI